MNDCEKYDSKSSEEQSQVIVKTQHNFSYANYSFLVLQGIILLVGLGIVFIRKRDNSKPTFIKVIWVLLCLAELTTIVHWIIYIRLQKI